MRLAAMILAAAVLAAAPAIAQTDPTLPPAPSVEDTTPTPPAAGETPPATSEESNDGGEEICRTIQRTESRLRSRRERVCMSRAQWEQIENDSRNTVNRAGSVQGARE